MIVRRSLSGFLVLLALLLVSAPLKAVSPPKVKTFQKGHEIRLGIGALDIYTIGQGMSYDRFSYYWSQTGSGNHIYRHHYGGYGSGFQGMEDMMSSYRGAKIATGTIQLAYNYRVSRWFEFAVYGTYTGFLQKRYLTYDNTTLENNNKAIVGLMPSVRVVWVNRDAFRFYSSFGLGLAGGFSQNYTEILPMINISWLGFSFGRKVYGFTEFAVGSLGTVSAGIGYKF